MEMSTFRICPVDMLDRPQYAWGFILQGLLLSIQTNATQHLTYSRPV